MRILSLVLWFCLLLPQCLLAKPLAPQDVPEPLKPWIGWVLAGSEQWQCPFLYDNVEEHRCAWPTRLELSLEASSGNFAADWQVDAEAWVPLPGGESAWPVQVEVDGKPAVVLSHDHAPALWLAPGPHKLTGRFIWERLPENLPIPRASGLLSLKLQGKPVQAVFNGEGGLWLQGVQGQDQTESANTLAVRVYRRIIDGVPLRVLTRLELEVAGQGREVLLAGALLPEALPLSLQSLLPARLEPDGRLRILLRPGLWNVELTTRQPAETQRLALPATVAEPWPALEIWSFEANSEMRVVEVGGVSVTDPRQSEMPDDWKSLPAYRVAAGSVMTFKTLRRGDAESAPDKLHLRRTLWLDFDGGGYTVHDQISGSSSRNWRLDALPGMKPGRVDIDGVPQLLTRSGEPDRAGVELRRSDLHLEADSRIEGRRSPIAATGWARDFQTVETRLNLPPGWLLLATTGVDNAPETWIGRWSLLDLFLVLIASLAVVRLRGRFGGALAALTLVLLWQEPAAPKLVWLQVLLAVALLQVLPEGRLASAARFYRNLAVLSLALISLPFMAGQMRLSLYPQLEIPGTAGNEFKPQATATQLPSAQPDQNEAEPRPMLAPEGPLLRAPAAPAPSAEVHNRPEEAYESGIVADARGHRPGVLAKASLASVAAPSDMESDPDALTQTGPGLPQWQWKALRLSWNGPVLASQDLGLILLPPTVSRLLNLLRVALTVVLALVVLGKQWGSSGKFRFLPRPDILAVAIFCVCALPQAKAEMPSPQLLEELKTRMLSPPECQPDCAEIATLRLGFNPGALSQRLEIHVLAALAVPLSAQEGQWLPEQVLVDGKAAESLFRGADGVLWLGLKPGRHEVLLSGSLPKREQVQLALPLKPHRVVVEGGGWQVEGIKENGEPENQLQLTRRLAEGEGRVGAELEAKPLPPFLEVRRNLRLGLEWRVSTEVVRLSPADAPVVVEIPLLAGESVTTPGYQVKNGKLALSLAAGQSLIGWESKLEKRPTLALTAPSTTVWSEVWRADVGPVWHLETKGIAPSQHLDSQGKRLTEWRPWPGESVELQLQRPQGEPGSTLTLQNSHLRLTPGLRATDASLSLAIRSSQGGQHTVKIPEGAQLQAVTLDGVARPIRQQGQWVTLPIRPGMQNVLLSWRQDTGITALLTTPSVDLGAPSVNAALSVSLGQDRWALLTHGPLLGPAVLFWGVLAVLALLAWGLGLGRSTPLSRWQWFLLLLGFSQVDRSLGLCVIAWLFALGWRGRHGTELSASRFNALQLGLALLTVLALSSLFYAVQHGLLGLPDMQVAGNGSTALYLNWYQDRNAANLPQAWVLTAPLWAYRVLMLLWALWLAYSLLDWLRWGYANFASGGLWQPRPLRPIKPDQAKEPAKSP